MTLAELTFEELYGLTSKENLDLNLTCQRILSTSSTGIKGEISNKLCQKGVK